MVVLMCGQREILRHCRTETVAAMFTKLSADKIQDIKAALTAEERADVASELRAGGFEAAAAVVMAA